MISISDLAPSERARRLRRFPAPGRDDAESALSAASTVPIAKIANAALDFHGGVVPVDHEAQQASEDRASERQCGNGAFEDYVAVQTQDIADRHRRKPAVR